MTATPIRFMSNNFLEREFTYSSQINSSFPATNSTNTSRSKVWKTGGNFEIDSTNNTIYINDGSNKTITLTSGSYTYTTLASHIQTQLNASSSNWTCTYSTTTYKFTIARSSGTAVLRHSQTTTAAWSTLGYTGTSDTTTSSPFEADEQRNHTSEWVQCDVGVPQQATFVGIISGIDETFTLSETAEVRVQANNIDNWTSPPVDIEVSVTSLGCFKFLDSDNEASYRFWRVKIIDKQNHRGPTGIELAYIYLGDHTTIAATNLSRGFSRTLVDPSVLLQSESGALFLETKPRYLSFSGCTIQLISGAEQREIEQLFYDLGVRTPFFVSIDPGEEITADLEELTRFVIMSRPPTLQHVFRNYYTIDFEMREAF